MPRHVRAVRDPSLQARVVGCVPLLYREGPDPSLDRPAHVRAGSSLARINGRLAVVQDDANFIALVDPHTGLAEALPLPGGPDTTRLFDDGRGNKSLKLDVEACVAVPSLDGPGERLLALGSGSRRPRERVLLARIEAESPTEGLPGGFDVRVFDAPSLYNTLRAQPDFAGSDMNIEGAVYLSGSVRLFGRGNGAARGGLVPLDATCDLSWPALHARLHNSHSPLRVSNIVQYDLGAVNGARLSFTDAALWVNSILFSCSAELSPDAGTDGPVAGSALGVMGSAGEAPRWAPLLNADGTLFPAKVEGVLPAGREGSLAYVVVDRDDYTRPSELCTVELSGPWRAEAPASDGAPSSP